MYVIILWKIITMSRRQKLKMFFVYFKLVWEFRHLKLFLNWKKSLSSSLHLYPIQMRSTTRILPFHHSLSLIISLFCPHTYIFPNDRPFFVLSIPDFLLLLFLSHFLRDYHPVIISSLNTSPNHFNVYSPWFSWICPLHSIVHILTMIPSNSVHTL